MLETFLHIPEDMVSEKNRSNPERKALLDQLLLADLFGLHNEIALGQAIALMGELPDSHPFQQGMMQYKQALQATDRKTPVELNMK